MRTTFSIGSAVLVALAFSAANADAHEIGHGPHHAPPHHAGGHRAGPHAVHGEHRPHGEHEVHPHVHEPLVGLHIGGIGHNAHHGPAHGPGLGVRAMPAHPPVHHGVGHRNAHHGVAHGHRNVHHGVAHGHHAHGGVPARRPGVGPRALHHGGGHRGGRAHHHGGGHHRGRRRRVPAHGRPHGGFGRHPGGRVRRDEIIAKAGAEEDGAKAEAVNDSLDKRDDELVLRDEPMAEGAAEENAAIAEPAEAMEEALGERHGRFPMHHGSATVSQMSPLLAIAAGVAATYAACF
ncbi:hypothetical protein H4R24_004271 [Coemansia sp. RSA 988]|nr:hypothetical protein H4R24_004271 [Coemansia sp. RSA 988]